MSVDEDYCPDSGEEVVAVSSRLLMIPAFIVVCMIVFGVLYALSTTVKKDANHHASRPPVSSAKQAGGGTIEIKVRQVSPRHMHTGRSFLPGKPAPAHST